MTKEQKQVIFRIVVAILLVVFLVIFQFPNKFEKLKIVLFIITYLIIGYDILLEALEGILKLELFDENFLMAVATVGAILLGEFFEGVAVMLFFQIGELFQDIAVGKSRKNIRTLMDIRPDFANIENKYGELEKVEPNSVKVGSVIVVRPGEKIPIDGIILQGTTFLDTSALTGESMPRQVFVGDEVLSGSINNSGLIKIQTTKEFGQSTAAKILELVENASSKKSKSENFISKFAHIYTPIVCACAFVLAILPPLFLGASSEVFKTWIYRALTFLVISCPCALVISIPLTFFAGIGGASSNGILIKGSNYMETLSKVKYLVFDKTGTMTKGVFEVVGVHKKLCDDKVQSTTQLTEEKELLEIVALAESFSTHPISKSLIKAYGKEIDSSRVKDVKEIAGHGIKALVDGKKVLVGNEKLMARENIQFKSCNCIGTVIHVAIDGKYAGHILISDILKPTSKDAIVRLKSIGIKQNVMLTGDEEKVAKKVQQELQIDSYFANLLPEDKVQKVEELLAQKPFSQKLAFVGDGINDAPVLSRADVGISMGALGSDAAIEASDVVLMDDNPLKIAKSILIAKKCLRIVYQNISFALLVKFVCLILGALGISTMWFAIFADVGVMVLCVINSIRALFVKSL